jgi:hypothetical protein
MQAGLPGDAATPRNQETRPPHTQSPETQSLHPPWTLARAGGLQSLPEDAAARLSAISDEVERSASEVASADAAVQAVSQVRANHLCRLNHPSV